MNEPQSILNGTATALTIAGFDPSSGAGITADLLVFAAHGIFATSAITALTVQSTVGVRSVHPAGAGLLADTLACLEADLPPAGVKIGMLAEAEQVAVVADYLAHVRKLRPVAVVLDPVLRSSSGAVLLSEPGQQVLQERLLPLADVVTPNLLEAEVLTGLSCTSAAEMERCALALRQQYSNLTIILTGGHLNPPNDLFASEEGMQWLEGTRVTTRATHGTGCAFSSALLAGRLLEQSWIGAARVAKQYVRGAMLTAATLGRGNGPLNLLRRP